MDWPPAYQQASLLLPVCLDLAKVLGQNFAAAIKSAADDLRAQCFDIGNLLVVLNNRCIRSDVHGSSVDAGHALQLLLDSAKVEYRRHATDVKNGSFHVATLCGSMENHTGDVEAGVDMHDLTCDGARIIACQHHGHPTDLASFNSPPQRRFARGFIQEFVKMLDA